MNLKIFIPLCFILFILASCRKDKNSGPQTIAVEFTSTEYKTLGSYDMSGRPDYLLAKDVITPNLLSFINSTLTEQSDLRKSKPELLSSSAIADIKITQSSDVFVTFVYQRTANSNPIAFYTYPTNAPPNNAKDIKTITYIFPNAGGTTTLQAGDKVKIGRFEAGTSIGFVLLQDGWSTTTKTLNNNAIHFCSNDVLNPEINPDLKKHAVLINYAAENKLLIGFEDMLRTDPKCDHDFNDVLIYASITP